MLKVKVGRFTYRENLNQWEPRRFARKLIARKFAQILPPIEEKQKQSKSWRITYLTIEQICRELGLSPEHAKETIRRNDVIGMGRAVRNQNNGDAIR